jgi:hypothetical protein
MAEVAAHLVDEVLPVLPARQWVLAVPKRLRYFPHSDATAKRLPERPLSREREDCNGSLFVARECRSAHKLPVAPSPQTTNPAKAGLTLLLLHSVFLSFLRASPAMPRPRSARVAGSGAADEFSVDPFTRT